MTAELGQAGFAEDEQALLRQALDDGGVRPREAVRERRGAGGGGHPGRGGGEDGVFDEEGDAVERAACFARGAFAVEGVRVGEGDGEGGGADDGAEGEAGAVVLLDLGEVVRDDLDAG